MTNLFYIVAVNSKISTTDIGIISDRTITGVIDSNQNQFVTNRASCYKIDIAILSEIETTIASLKFSDIPSNGVYMTNEIIYFEKNSVTTRNIAYISKYTTV